MVPKWTSQLGRCPIGPNCLNSRFVITPRNCPILLQCPAIVISSYDVIIIVDIAPTAAYLPRSRIPVVPGVDLSAPHSGRRQVATATNHGEVGGVENTKPLNIFEGRTARISFSIRTARCAARHAQLDGARSKRRGAMHTPGT